MGKLRSLSCFKLPSTPSNESKKKSGDSGRVSLERNDFIKVFCDSVPHNYSPVILSSP
jgi:hypothetical protein